MLGKQPAVYWCELSLLPVEQGPGFVSPRSRAGGKDLCVNSPRGRSSQEILGGDGDRLRKVIKPVTPRPLGRDPAGTLGNGEAPEPRLREPGIYPPTPAFCWRRAAPGGLGDMVHLGLALHTGGAALQPGEDSADSGAGSWDSPCQPGQEE